MATETNKKKNAAVITGGKSDNPRQENDFYPTPSASTQSLLDTGVLDSCKTFRDPCAGAGHITDVIAKNLIADYKDGTLFAEDLFDYGAKDHIKVGIDFLKAKPHYVDAIVTNPPYSRDILMPFVKKCLTESKRFTAMFLKITFLESTSRKEFFDFDKTLKFVMPFSNRQPMLKNGQVPKNGKVINEDGVEVKVGTNAIMYAWFVWDKEYDGEPTIKLIDNSKLVKENKAKGIY